jgi:hypothetical protein
MTKIKLVSIKGMVSMENKKEVLEKLNSKLDGKNIDFKDLINLIKKEYEKK